MSGRQHEPSVLDHNLVPQEGLRPAGPRELNDSGELFRLPPQGLVFEDLERDLVRQALDRTGGNQTRAARLLGMTRDQIRYRVRKFALAVRPESESAA